MTSTRRRARQREVVLDSANPESAGGIPAALAIGRCIEVWGGWKRRDTDEAGHLDDGSMAAFSRWGRVRSWWLAANNITDTADQCKVLPLGPPWSYDYAMTHGLEGLAEEHLNHAGVTADDFDTLRNQAIELHEQVH